MSDDKAITELNFALENANNRLDAALAAKLSADDLNRIRQWYNAMCDAVPEYAEAADHDLARKMGFPPNEKVNR